VNWPGSEAIMNFGFWNSNFGSWKHDSNPRSEIQNPKSKSFHLQASVLASSYLAKIQFIQALQCLPVHFLRAIASRFDAVDEVCFRDPFFVCEYGRVSCKVGHHTSFILREKFHASRCTGKTGVNKL
jgi:hypothetical protein